MTKIQGADSMTRKQALAIIRQLPKYFMPVGSVLSEQPNPQDLDFLIVDIPLYIIKQYLENKFPNIWRESTGQTKRLDYFPIIDGKHIVMNFWATNKTDLPFYILAYGYPRGISIHLKKVAKDKNLLLSQYGLFDRATGQKLPVKTIKGIFKKLSVEYRTPAEDYRKHHKK